MEAIDIQGQNNQKASFTKGMTLSEYMSQVSFQNSPQNQQTQSEKQQNLYENQEMNESLNVKIFKGKYWIKQVEEESHEDSVDDQRDQQFTKKIENQQLTKQTFRETNYFNPSPALSNSKPSMNSTAYFNNSIQKNSFRIKHFSNSPYKKKPDNMPGGTMTLYGRKFMKSIRKETPKIPQLATFYGKIKQKTQEKPIKIQRMQKKSASKYNFKKKNQLELQDLIKFEQKIKSNYSQKIYFQDIRIEGLKDKICQRKNKLF